MSEHGSRKTTRQLIEMLEERKRQRQITQNLVTLFSVLAILTWCVIIAMVVL